MHRTIVTKSFFQRFLLSYLFVLAIPILTICLTYSVAHRSIREEIVRSNSNSLRQFAGIADSRFAVMAATAREVLQNTTVRDFANTYPDTRGDYGYKAYQVNTYLSGLPNVDFSDLFVYFMRSEHIISSFKASLSSEMYMDIYYGNTPETTEVDWNRTAILRLPTENVPTLTVLNPNAFQPHIALMVSQNSGFVRGRSNIVACIVLQPDQLNQTLGSARYHPDSVIGVMNHQGDLLATSGVFPDDYDLDLLLDDNRISENETHVFQHLPSGVADCRYVIATPRAVFWARLNTLRLLSIGSLLLCLIVSAYVAILFSRRNYLPITHVLETIYSKTHQLPASGDANEMEFIHHVLSRSLEENNLLTSRIASEHNTLRDDFLLRALAGTCTGDAQEDVYAASNINLLSDRFCVVLLRVDCQDEGNHADHMAPAATQRLSQAFSDLIQQLPSSHKKYLVALSPILYACILNFSLEASPDDCREDALRFCEKLTASIRKECGCTCTFGVSRNRTGLPGIHIAYEQALLAMKYRYLFGPGSIIRHEDIADRTFQFDHASEFKASQLMLHHVQGTGDSSSQEVVQQVMACSQIDAGVSMETVECFKYDLIGGLTRILHETGTMKLEKEQHLIHGLISADTMGEFWNRLTGTLDILRRHHQENRVHFTVCDRAADYIRQYFTDATLNNTGISEALNISPSYLSKLFKEQRGDSLLEYLAKVRVLHAKKLLAQTRKTMEDIASASGFLSSGTFIKTFKKVEGITPGAYRKLVLPPEEAGSDEGDVA